MNVIYEDDYILVCDKPAGTATQAGKVTEKDMVSEVNNYLRRAGAKAPAYLIHRLDKPVRGVLLFAKTKESAANLNKQITSKEFHKEYFAIVQGVPEKLEDMLKNDIYKDGNKAYIFESKPDDSDCDKISVSSGNKANSSLASNIDIKKALLKYKCIYSNGKYDLDLSEAKKLFIKGMINDTVNEEDLEHISVLDIKLLTGRFHQIRCQLSNIGNPIAGDKEYGSDISQKNRKAIGLIAYSLTFNHPKTGKPVIFTVL